MKTRTGSFPIGLRRGWSDWQKDLSGIVTWAKQSGLEVLDPGSDGDSVGREVVAAGLRIGSVDLLEWKHDALGRQGQNGLMPSPKIRLTSKPVPLMVWSITSW